MRRYIGPFIASLVITFIIKESMLFFLEVYISVIILSLLFNKKLLINKIKKQLKYKTYKFSVSLNDNGIEYATFDYRVKLNWPSVTGIVDTENYIHIYNDLKEELFIPKKAFNNADDKTTFIEQLNKYSTNIIN